MRGPDEHDRIPAKSPRSSHQNAPTRARARSNRFSSIAAIRPDEQNPRSAPYDPERLRIQARRPPILPVNQTNETHTNLLPARATPLPPYPHLYMTSPPFTRTRPICVTTARDRAEVARCDLPATSLDPLHVLRARKNRIISRNSHPWRCLFNPLPEPPTPSGLP